MSQRLKGRLVVISSEAVLVAAADELEDQVGGACIVTEVAYLVADQERRACVVAQPAFECAGGLLTVEVEQQVGGGGEERGVSGEDGLMGDVLRQHCFSQAVGVGDILRRISVN